MMELFWMFLGIAGTCMGVWLAFIPWNILVELRKQGDLRSAEAARMTAILQMIARGEKPAAFHEISAPEPLQAALDARLSQAS